MERKIKHCDFLLKKKKTCTEDFKVDMTMKIWDESGFKRETKHNIPLVQALKWVSHK